MKVNDYIKKVVDILYPNLTKEEKEIMYKLYITYNQLHH